VGQTPKILFSPSELLRKERAAHPPHLAGRLAARSPQGANAPAGNAIAPTDKLTVRILCATATGRGKGPGLGTALVHLCSNRVEAAQKLSQTRPSQWVLLKYLVSIPHRGSCSIDAMARLTAKDGPPTRKNRVPCPGRLGEEHCVTIARPVNASGQKPALSSSSGRGGGSLETSCRQAPSKPRRLRKSLEPGCSEGPLSSMGRHVVGTGPELRCETDSAAASMSEGSGLATRPFDCNLLRGHLRAVASVIPRH
jgi:hypothetical protein